MAYSEAEVRAVLRHWDDFIATGRLPKRASDLLDRVQLSRWRGGSAWEMPIARKNDIEAAIARLDHETRRVLVTGRGHALSHGAALAKMRYSTYRDHYNRAIEELTEVLNGQEETMPRTTNGYHTDPDKQLPKGPPPDERELYAAFDALERKLTKLNGLEWRSATIRRTDSGFACSVTV